MSPARKPSPSGTRNQSDEALNLAEELLGWALVREKVLEKLDTKAARRARTIADSLRKVVRVSRSTTAPSFPEGFPNRELAELSAEATDLMAGRISSVPPVSGSRSLYPSFAPASSPSSPSNPGVELSRTDSSVSGDDYRSMVTPLDRPFRHPEPVPVIEAEDEDKTHAIDSAREPEDAPPTRAGLPAHVVRDYMRGLKNR